MYAKSLIRSDRLGKELQDDLVNGKLGIGGILRDRRMETYREVISCESGAAGEMAPLISAERGDKVISRTYMIFSSQNPIMMITETFPEKIFIGIERGS